MTVWQGVLREVKKQTGLILTSFLPADICEQFYVREQGKTLAIPVFVGPIAANAKVVLNGEYRDERSDFGCIR